MDPTDNTKISNSSESFNKSLHQLLMHAKENTQAEHYVEKLQMLLKNHQADMIELVRAQNGDYQNHKTLNAQLKNRIRDLHQEEEKLNNNPEYQAIQKAKTALFIKINDLEQSSELSKQAKLPDIEQQLKKLEQEAHLKEEERDRQITEKNKLESKIYTLEKEHNALASRYVLAHLECEFLETLINKLTEKNISLFITRIFNNELKKAEDIESCTSLKKLHAYINNHKTIQLHHHLETLKNTSVKHLGELYPVENFFGFYRDDAVTPLSAYLGVARPTEKTEAQKRARTSQCSPFSPPPPLPPVRPSSVVSFRPVTPEPSRATTPSGKYRKRLANEDRRERRNSENDFRLSSPVNFL